MPELNAALLNRLLSARANELVHRRPAASKEQLHQRVTEDKVTLQKALGLYPFPARSDLNAKVTGTIKGDGYRIEKVIIEARPDFHVPIHLYIPDGGSTYPAVVYAPEKGWSKATPWVQSAGIGLALLGFACVVVDPPGAAERLTQGDLDLDRQSLGLTVLGEYAWDLIRALDYCESRSDILIHKVGVTGMGFGGYACLLGFALDERFHSAAPVCAGASIEQATSFPEDLKGLAGLLNLGDISDIAVLRAPAPALFLSAEDEADCPAGAQKRTELKLKSTYKLFKADNRSQLQLFLGKRDYNRRMREAMYGFFQETLKVLPGKSYLDEPRPLTDGNQNPYAAGTLPEDSPELLCGTPASEVTYEQLLEQALAQPYPEPFDPATRYIAWAKYGQLPEQPAQSEFTILDSKEDGTGLVLPFSEIRHDLCVSMGIGIPEFFAHLLHQILPGGPDGWEVTAQSGHALTSMLASVKTLVSGTPVAEVQTLRAIGPVASLTALFLQKLRPTLAVSVSHTFADWPMPPETTEPALFQPGTRYLRWPFARPEALPKDSNAPEDSKIPDESAEDV
jgi:dienelactone hydrolase